MLSLRNTIYPGPRRFPEIFPLQWLHSFASFFVWRTFFRTWAKNHTTQISLSLSAERLVISVFELQVSVRRKHWSYTVQFPLSAISAVTDASRPSKGNHSVHCEVVPVGEPQELSRQPLYYLHIFTWEIGICKYEGLKYNTLSTYWRNGFTQGWDIIETRWNWNAKSWVLRMVTHSSFIILSSYL